jgi:hypothetical protein
VDEKQLSSHGSSSDRISKAAGTVNKKEEQFPHLQFHRIARPLS